MRTNDRDALAFSKLLKVARGKMDEIGRLVAELEAARRQTEESLRLLADAVDNEEAAALAANLVGFAQLSGYFAGAAQKRAALLETRVEIAADIDSARADLEQAFGEMKRLEYLIERARLFAGEVRRKRESLATDAAAIARHRASSGRQSAVSIPELSAKFRAI